MENGISEDEFHDAEESFEDEEEEQQPTEINVKSNKN